MNDPNNNQWNNSQNNNGNNPNQQMNNNRNNNPQNNYNHQNNNNQQNNNLDENSIITGLFYKFDKRTNQYRIAKTKTITLAVFFFMLLFGLWAIYDSYGYLDIFDFIGAVIISLIVAIPVFIIGFIIGKVIENDTNVQYNQQMPNGPMSDLDYHPPNGQHPQAQPFNQMQPNQYNPQEPNQMQPNQYNPQQPNQMQPNQYNPPQPNQMPNNQFNQPNNQQVPNNDFNRVNTQQMPISQDANANNNQNYYNPPTDNTPDDTQKNDTPDTGSDEQSSTIEDYNNQSNVENTDIEESTSDNNDNSTTGEYYDRDNLGTNHDRVEKATAYWLGERFQSEYKPPFTMYIFDNATDAENALLDLPYIHKAVDTGKLICDEVFIYGYYKVSEANYEAIICGKDLTYEEFAQAEEAFEKHGGKRKNHLAPEKTAVDKKDDKPADDTQNKESSVKFREKITKDQFTYECYDADNKNDALEFLKQQDVNQRLYYICVYTPEGDYGKDIDGVYQM